MNVGSMGGVMGSAAGRVVADGRQRSRTDPEDRRSGKQSTKKAADAAGIGTTEEDQGASGQDADSRCLGGPADKPDRRRSNDSRDRRRTHRQQRQHAGPDG
jgi:hypothetical protein